MTLPDIPFAPSPVNMRRILCGEELFLGKDRARCVIAGDRMLTIPVEGGASILKNPHISTSDIRISDHGRWRREHLGTWNASYGKTPFFPHIFPLLEEAYETGSHGSLKEFNDIIFDIILEFTEFREVEADIRRMEEKEPERLRQVVEELKTKVNINYSIFDALFRLGKESIFII